MRNKKIFILFLDDLWASVKDGRYEEQKFRMKSCGLVHLYYLIEDYSRSGGGGGGGASPEAINQVCDSLVQECEISEAYKQKINVLCDFIRQ
jgi:ERCC4-type nuclease